MADRLFINDMNGPLYILNKRSLKFTTYLDFNGRDTRPGMFHKFAYEAGYGTGFASAGPPPPKESGRGERSPMSH